MKNYIVVIFSLLLVSCVGAGETTCSHRATSPDHVFCTLFPESTQGPYYVDDMAVRQNITEGKPGVALELSITVVNFETCQPLVEVPVDIWSCDAVGEYSSFVGVTLPPAVGPEGNGYTAKPLDDKTFLRGVQYTNNNGDITFHTLFPGWYPERTIHIHVMAHVNNRRHTGQFYFEEELSGKIALLEPYKRNTVTRLTNHRDRIFNSANGKATTLKLIRGSDGYKASILMGVNK